MRKIAKENSLINHNKKDEKDWICFIGERKYNDFVGQYIKTSKGDIISIDGEKLGNIMDIFILLLANVKV